MFGLKFDLARELRGFLSIFAKDVRGNTLAIMAAALIPLAGLVGGGIDISRMYITKTRLQHACDAGALAGRKAMGGGTWTQTVNGTANYPNATAQQFFDSNFQTGAYGSSNLSRSFSESAGKVSGTASATLPMTLMRIFGKTTDTLSVACDAEMRLPNTDVMFVLDVTGSMNCAADDSKCTNNNGVPETNSKIGGLKTAVKCFYEIVARLPTNATCANAKPSGGTGNQTQIRFGFVPYASNVNVGFLLPTAYFANSWNYQSRVAHFTPVTTYTYPNQGSASITSTSYSWNSSRTWSLKAITTSGSSASNCQKNDPDDTDPVATGSTGAAYNQSSSQSNGVQTVTWKQDTPVRKYTYRYNTYQKNVCYWDRSPVTGTQTDTYTRYDQGVPQTTQKFDGWIYKQVATDISGLKNGTSWNTSFNAPLGSSGGNVSISWDGCIEERGVAHNTTDFDPIPSDANDLNIDMVPDVNDTTNGNHTQWGPSLPDAIYYRNVTSSYSQMTTATSSVTTTNYYQGAADYCPTQAKKLQSWATADDFDDYVDSLSAQGNTYHDIGMIWGARLMSPTGIFASENAYTQSTPTAQGGGEIERHMIFMTDGDSTSSPCDYNAYGVPWYDQRETTDVGSASNCTSNRQQLIDQINLRLAALCTAVKNKNITLWVISYGNGTNTDTENRLKTCASDGKYFSAADPDKLQTTFATIANQISQLRLTK